MAEENGWGQYSKLVLAELKNHNKRLVSIDTKLDNHITHIEHRLTKIETTLKNLKWILGILFPMVAAILLMLLSIIIGGS